MRQLFPEFRQLFRIGRTYHSTHCGIAIGTDLPAAPVFAHFAHDLIDRLAVDQSVLQFSAGRIRGLCQHENTLVIFFANVQQRLNAVCSQIAVDCQCICSKGFQFHAVHIYFSQMCGGICSHGRTNVIAFAVCHDEHALALCIANGFRQCADTCPAVHFIVCSLRLDRRNHIVQGIDQRLVELENCISSCLQCMSQLHKAGILYELRHVFQTWIQSGYGRIVQFVNSFDKSIKSHCIGSFLLNTLYPDSE